MIRFRFPALELLAALHGGAFSRSGRALAQTERDLLREAFGESIDLDLVRIAETRIANSPTTLGNVIRVRPGAELPAAVLVHEAAHIWQFQTKGTAYVSDSAFHQGVSLLRTGGRDAAYEVVIVPGQSIHDYTAEQQAMIIENQFAYPQWRENAEVQRMMEEVRRARPLPMDAIVQEAVFGAMVPRLGDDPGQRPPPVPLFRIEL